MNRGITIASGAVTGGIMNERRSVAQCRWAEATLFLAHPFWTEADAYPWSCTADGDPAVVEDTGRCANCGRWSPKTPHRLSSSDCSCQTPGGCVIKLP